MKQYQLSFSLFRRFHFQYFEKSRNRINDSVVYHGRHRVCAEKCTNLKWYSSGFLGVNRIPTNVDDDIHSGGTGEVYQNTIDVPQLGQPSDKYRNEGYGENSGQFQHMSNLRNHYPLNDWNLQNVHPQKPGYFSGGNAGEYQQATADHWLRNSGQGDLYNRNKVTSHPECYQLENTGVQLGSNGYHQANSSFSAGNLGGYNNGQPGTYQQNVGVLSGSNGQSDLYNRNKVTSYPGSYQPENTGVQLSSNGYHQATSNFSAGNPGGYNNGQPGSYEQNVGVQSGSNGYQQVNYNFNAGNPSGYYNGQWGSNQQNFVGSHYPNVSSQMPVSSTPVGHLGEADGGSDRLGASMLEQFDALCKEWDLESAVKLMEDMGEEGVSIDIPRYMILIKACGVAKAAEEAKAVHKHIMRFISPVKVSTFNRILEMYGKCGLMEDALNTFNQMPERNLTSWDTMITWFARNGLGEDAIDMFTRFKESGLKPDGQMFLGVFDACGVVGDVNEGMLHFDSMSKIYGITPSTAHYARIVHMFGSAGYLDGALEFIENMPMEPSVDVWESLMNISRIQGNLELGDRCALIVEQMNASCLTEESKSGLLPVNDSEIPKKKVRKASPLEHTKHEYRAGDRSHPENDKIYAALRGMKEQLKEAGYIAETKFVLHDIDPEGKEEAIMAHSERLACTYALLTSAARMPIRIIKNLRVCNDCHNVFKIISSLVGREVVMRDAKRFHHFKDGKCSCNDYW